jgi:hypothetical protein
MRLVKDSSIIAKAGGSLIGTWPETRGASRKRGYIGISLKGYEN